jgi:hypothetical protein
MHHPVTLRNLVPNIEMPLPWEIYLGSYRSLDKH